MYELSLEQLPGAFKGLDISFAYVCPDLFKNFSNCNFPTFSPPVNFFS